MELSSEEIRRLYAAAETSEYPARDGLLARAALYWGFTSTELSLLEISHVMSVEGEWRERFLVPGAFAFNGLPRSAWILDERFKRSLDAWLEERRERHWGMDGAPRHRGFAGDSP